MTKLYRLTDDQVVVLRQGLMLLEQERRWPRSVLLPPLVNSLQILLTDRALLDPVREEQGE